MNAPATDGTPNMSTSRSALVTGATGFIGSHLREFLLRSGTYDRVLGTRRANPRARGDAPPGDDSNWIVCDLGASEQIDLPAGIETVFHLAGKAHALTEIGQGDDEYTRINRDGTRRLLEAAQRAGVREFVFISTVKAVGGAPEAQLDGRTCGQSEGRMVGGADGRRVGQADGRTGGRSDGTLRPIDETVEWPADTAYGRSKREAERLVLHGGYVPHAVVLRPSLVYGPKVPGNLEKMIEAVRRGLFPPVPDVGNKRSMVHVDDLIAAAILTARRSEACGQTYIVTDNAPCSTREMFVWTCAALGRPVPRWTAPRWTLHCAARVGDVIGKVRGRRFRFDSDALTRLLDSAWYSSARLQKELGWKPQHTLRDSLPEIVRSLTR